MGMARRHLGMSPELFDHTKAISTGNRRVDVLLDEGMDTESAKTLATAHAPVGGITIAGRFFNGGEFIPSGQLAHATPDQMKKIEFRKPIELHPRDDDEDEDDIEDKPTLAEQIKDAWHNISAEDSHQFRDGTDAERTTQERLTDKTLEQAVMDAQKWIDKGEDVDDAIRRSVADIHFDKLKRSQKADREEQEEQERINGEKLQKRIEHARSMIEQTLGVKFKESKSGSLYAYLMGRKLRLSDHAQKPGGGFNEGTGERMGMSDIQWVVNNPDGPMLTEKQILDKVAEKFETDADGLIEMLEERKQQKEENDA